MDHSQDNPLREGLRLEATAEPCTVMIFGASGDLTSRKLVPAFYNLAREGLLQSYRPTWADHVPPEARGEGENWYGTYFTPEVIGFNSKAVQGDTIPRDWDDILLPRWKGRIILRDPVASGTLRTIFGAMLFRARQTGSPEKGFDWLRRLDANTKEYVANSTLLFQKVARGEADITLWNMPDMEL